MALDIKPINYAEEYHEDKPSIFRESENLDRLLQAIFDVCYQQQLDFLWLSQNLLNVDVAEKSHLDFIGNIVGQPRFLSDFNTEPYFGFDGSYQSKPFSSVTNPDIGGFWNSRSHFNTATARQLNDEEYRRLIKARAIYHQSNCTANDLLEVINLLSNSKNNTVQMISHGLIQIKTDDSSGIISYFVDRLLNDDNILPIAAGVRVGLEALPTGDVTNISSFLKLRNDQEININDGLIGGLVYSIDGGAISAVKEVLPSITEDELGQIIGTSFTMYAFLSSPPMGFSMLGFGRDGGFGWADTDMPTSLDIDKFYWFGMTDIIVQDYFNIRNMDVPEVIVQKDVMITVYPANRLPSENIDYDLFDLIIDPASYTQADLQYFSERGITPATKNPDGSYTLKSQLKFEF